MPPISKISKRMRPQFLIVMKKLTLYPPSNPNCLVKDLINLFRDKLKMMNVKKDILLLIIKNIKQLAAKSTVLIKNEFEDHVNLHNSKLSQKNQIALSSD